MNDKAPLPLAHLARWVTAFAGAGLVAAAPANGRVVDPATAPVEWVHYAQGATAVVMRLLKADNEVAVRLRAYLDQTRPAPGEPTAPLVLKLWIDRDGAVSRVDFTPFVHPEPNADLRSLIVGQKLDGAPPRNMLLPLRIAVQLAAASAELPEPSPALAPSRSNPI
ncbi:hypothetical protein RN629_05255 [Sphingomonadaceae bacterium jetA1]|jgi:hypothetical protein|uniref:hypothetical protein n=1 Tax=Facivitalis istanbulensis TaxID=3075838 RepID=UPI003472E974